MNALKEKIEQIYSRKPEELGKTEFELFEQFKSLLNSGEIRSAEKIDGEWQVNRWVKKGILLGFRLGKLVDCSIDEQFRFFDKSTYPLKKIQIEDKIRQVPGGSSIRDGAYVAPGVVIMPPAYINVGAYVDEETMVDSHALVGSCAQIGKNVHLSGGVGIGGVLEPVQATPVIIEDNAFIGSRSIVVEGVIIHKEAVLGANVVITQSTKIIDVSGSEAIEYKGEVPAGSVVIPGGYTKEFPAGKYQVPCALIIGQRKESTDKKTTLNDALREFKVSV